MREELLHYGGGVPTPGTVVVIVIRLRGDAWRNMDGREDAKGDLLAGLLTMA